MRSRRASAAAALGMIGVLALAACSSDEKTAEATSETTAETPAPAQSTAESAVADTTVSEATRAPAGPQASAETAAPSASTAEPTAGTGARTGRTVAGSLASVCPATVTFQTDWSPESEHGQLYQMVGADYSVDDGKKSVTGTLFDGDVDTGVKIEVRAGGLATNFQTVTAVMYAEPAIFAGYVSTDEAVSLSGEFPTTAVVAPFNKNPQIIMWDPATYPDVKKIADLPKTTKIRHFGGAAYIEYLISSGQMTREQSEGSYDGTPANFVADAGKSAQQGFVSAEPYFYEKDLKEWGKPVAYELIHDAGWTAYAQSLAVRSETLTEKSACLKLLVPVIQRAQRDYIKDAAKADALILELVEKYNTGWVYTAPQAKASVESQLKDQLVANSPDGTLGSFDIARLDQFLPKAVDVFTKTSAKVKPELTVNELVTNEFIDPSVKL